MRPILAELLQQRRLPDPVPSVDDEVLGLSRFLGGLQRLEFRPPVVEGHYLDNQYYDNDLCVSPDRCLSS